MVSELQQRGNRNIQSLFHLNNKAIINCVLSPKEVILVVHVLLMRWMNIIVQPKINNHRNTSKQHQPLFYIHCRFKRSKKCLDQEELRSIIYCSLES